jgi:hypothetical protein
MVLPGSGQLTTTLAAIGAKPNEKVQGSPNRQPLRIAGRGAKSSDLVSVAPEGAITLSHFVQLTRMLQIDRPKLSALFS